jgi:hypothetical protein
LWDFADAIANNKQPACDAQAGAQTSIIAIKAAQAITSGEPMKL